MAQAGDKTRVAIGNINLGRYDTVFRRYYAFFELNEFKKYYFIMRQTVEQQYNEQIVV